MGLLKDETAGGFITMLLKTETMSLPQKLHVTQDARSGRGGCLVINSPREAAMKLHQNTCHFQQFIFLLPPSILVVKSNTPHQKTKWPRVT